MELYEQRKGKIDVCKINVNFKTLNLTSQKSTINDLCNINYTVVYRNP